MFAKHKNIIHFTPTMPFLAIKQCLNDYLTKKINLIKKSKMYIKSTLESAEKDSVRKELNSIYQSIETINACQLFEDLYFKLQSLSKRSYELEKNITYSKLNLLYNALSESINTLVLYKNYIYKNSPDVLLTTCERKTLNDMNRSIKENNSRLAINTIPLMVTPHSIADFKKLLINHDVLNPALIDFLSAHMHQDGLLKYPQYFVAKAMYALLDTDIAISADDHVNLITYGYYEIIMDHTIKLTAKIISENTIISQPIGFTIRMLISHDSKNAPKVSGIELTANDKTVNSALMSIKDLDIQTRLRSCFNENLNKSFFEIESYNQVGSDNLVPFKMLNL